MSKLSIEGLGLVTLVAVLLVPLAAPDASALTAEQIDRVARFATSRLRGVTERLSAEDLEGRNNDTPASRRTQAYLISHLRRIGPGLDSLRSGDDAYRQPFEESGVRGTNLLAVIPGRELPDEFVVVGAHYDHLGRRCDSSPGGDVCNGATDNAAGTAAVIAIGNAIRHLPEPPRRSVVLALWDAEEDGLVGSRQYVANPLVPLERTVAYVNFDILGADLLPSMSRVSFAIASETGGAALEEAVERAIASEPLGTRLLSYVFGQLRSDYASFVAGRVPTVFFSDSTGACYHTTGDDLGLVDFAKLREQTRIAFRLVAGLAEEPTRPAFVEPSAALATYGDAVALRDVIAIGLADLHVLAPADQDGVRAIAASLGRIVEAGPDAFGEDDVPVLLDAALDTIGLLTRLECAGHDDRRRVLPELTTAMCPILRPSQG
jgi:Peptidase family M28